MAAIAVILVSCEKDEMMSPSNNNVEISKGKVKTPNSKNAIFPDNYWDGIDDFVYQINANQSYNSELEVNKALYYLESTMDWRFTGNSDNIVERTVPINELTYTLKSKQSDGDWVFTSNKITNINSRVYSDIANQATALSNESGKDVLIDIVDFDWDLNSSTGDVAVTVNAMLGVINNNIQPFAPSCQLLDGKVNVSARCNSSSGRSDVDEINFYLRPLCGSWNRRLTCNLNNSIVINPVTTVFNALTPCGSYVDGGLSWGSCRTAAQNQADFNSTRSVWNSNCFPQFATKKIRAAGYGAWNNNGHSTSNHHAKFFTVDGCRVLCNQPFGCPPPNRPMPIF